MWDDALLAIYDLDLDVAMWIAREQGHTLVTVAFHPSLMPMGGTLVKPDFRDSGIALREMVSTDPPDWGDGPMQWGISFGQREELWT